MAKSRDAFRTISEVSTELDIPTHVLRFWESKFTQIKPVKRAGGRRYYRPEDIALLSGIKVLLHEQGMTIKGAQKLLREEGVKPVLALSETLTPPQPAPVREDPVPIAAVPTPVPAPRPAASEIAPTSMLSLIAVVDHAKITANADKIAPLLARLEKLRDSLRAA
ncbi:MerR family transcriptional regulator [Yoonia sp. MH D7]